MAMHSPYKCRVLQSRRVINFSKKGKTTAVADHGFVDFKFSCGCSVSNFICTSNNFELIFKSKTLTSAFNTGHFDSKLLVATLIVSD